MGEGLERARGGSGGRVSESDEIRNHLNKQAVMKTESSVHALT